MQLSTSEISELIKSRLENFSTTAEARTQGTVVSVTDGIVRIHGLSNVMSGEMIEFPGNTYGLALNLERDSVGAVVLGDYEHITEGDVCKCTGRILEVPVGPELIGRVVNALGQPIDGKGPVNAKMTDKIEKVAPGLVVVGTHQDGTIEAVEHTGSTWIVAVQWHPEDTARDDPSQQGLFNTLISHAS